MVNKLTKNHSSGFTFIEIIVTLGVAIIILGIFVAVGDPVEMFKISRDNKRISDLSALKLAIATYIENSTTTDLDGPKFPGVGGAGVDMYPYLFISIPTEQITIPPYPTQCNPQNQQEWGFSQSDSTKLLKTDGYGWLPINFQELPLRVISELPIDPINSYAQGYYYSYAFKGYAPNTTERVFELRTNLESKTYSYGGKNDKESTDNGIVDTLYEIGTNLTLIPEAFTYECF
ncbi:MAG: prepilin-type N-terminal cleavage/methylation domain-containing protein [Patescibacteria group bacterium]